MVHFNMILAASGINIMSFIKSEKPFNQKTMVYFNMILAIMPRFNLKTVNII